MRVLTGAARRGRWLLPQLVLTLVLGLLGMHALVVVDGGAAGERAAVLMSSGPPAAHGGDTHEPVTALPDHHGMSAPADHPHPGPHQLLHLCLAVLAAVGLLVLLLVAVIPGRPRPAAVPGLVRDRREPPVRPPPTSTRLALLCVMRN